MKVIKDCPLCFVVTIVLSAFVGWLGGEGIVYVIKKTYTFSENYFAEEIKAKQLEIVFGCIDLPCIIKGNRGGEYSPFKKASELISKGDIVIVDGLCGSSCALFADFARPHVCVTEKAYFWFHKGYDIRLGKIVSRSDPPHSKDIFLWAKERGGFPFEDANGNALEMHYPETQKFWPLCKADNTPLQRSDRIKKTIYPWWVDQRVINR